MKDFKEFDPRSMIRQGDRQGDFTALYLVKRNGNINQPCGVIDGVDDVLNHFCHLRRLAYLVPERIVDG